ncbi:MAG: NCS2 family permease, partial [Deltaproteobacteria bacterium]|nr:NCS2 family permease [Deltaproteobacteria bacterium]
MTPASREILAGVTTFLTMSYIAVVNPAILSDGTGLEFAAVMTATVLVATLGSLAMGLIADLPYGVAPGMGLNAFVTYSLIRGDGYTGAEALGIVVVAGAVFVILSATPARIALAEAIPERIRHAAAGGIGLFLAFIGLKNAGVVVANPSTFVAPGALSLEVALAFAGVIATAALLHRQVRGGILIVIVAITGLSIGFGISRPPDQLLAAPDFSLLFAFDLSAAARVAVVGPLLTLLLTDLFDSVSTLLGVAHAAKLVDDDGRPLRLGRALLADALASLASGLAGSSPGTTYIESAAGVRAGGRRGLTAIVTGLCFLPLLFLGPLAQVVPAHATAPALIIVGLFMV